MLTPTRKPTHTFSQTCPYVSHAHAYVNAPTYVQNTTHVHACTHTYTDTPTRTHPYVQRDTCDLMRHIAPAPTPTSHPAPLRPKCFLNLKIAVSTVLCCCTIKGKSDCGRMSTETREGT
ncbi:hypothetical protein LOAG_15276 [Loa loa]|uniref:Uncharacterized protein n=1 Tax=Loa loa TaxID=7209 RepID=A0A1S0TG66_LOALO|nr:hypothetical protein LOAG_15276 [Loa loa]EFO13254.2 hypothetical protein LOAG_15276 [Loa loa]